MLKLKCIPMFINKEQLYFMMEGEDKLSIIEKNISELKELSSRFERRMALLEDEIERMQKDLQILGESTEIKTPCFLTFENSLTKKLIKESNEATNASKTLS